MSNLTRADEIFEIQMPDCAGDGVLPSPALLEFYKSLDEREIVLNGDILPEDIDIPHYIRKWNKEDKDIQIEERKPIKIFINTNGGDVLSVLLSIEVIKISKTPVVTIAMSRAYSCGFLLLMAGHKRYAFKTSTVLLHDGSTFIGGDTGKTHDAMAFYNKQETLVKDLVLKCTNITEEDYDRNYRHDWWMMADEAVKYGVVDKIISDMDEII